MAANKEMTGARYAGYIGPSKEVCVQTVDKNWKEREKSRVCATESLLLLADISILL